MSDACSVPLISTVKLTYYMDPAFGVWFAIEL